MDNYKKFITESSYVADVPLDIFDSDKTDAVCNVCKALCSPIRLQILSQISSGPQSISELARQNGMSVSTAAFHVNLLKKARLINIRYTPGKKGYSQVCTIRFGKLTLGRAPDQRKNRSQTFYRQSVEVGNYVDCQASGLIAITRDDKLAFLGDDPFGSKRDGIKMLWFANDGRLSYRFGNGFTAEHRVIDLAFSLEVCSETSMYCNDWKSDITFWVNGRELATYTSPGDFGGKRGRLTPEWWTVDNTQYGTLIDLSINDTGTYINNERVGDTTLADLELDKNSSLLFSLGVKPDAHYVGGLNLFGKTFGNHPQDIEMSVVCEPKN